jgi:hypothetical protein
MTTTTATNLFPCIRCGCQESSLKLHLDDCEGLECSECGEVFSPADVRAHVGQLARLLRVCDAAKAAMAND